MAEMRTAFEMEMAAQSSACAEIHGKPVASRDDARTQLLAGHELKTEYGVTLIHVEWVEYSTFGVGTMYIYNDDRPDEELAYPGMEELLSACEDRRPWGNWTVYCVRP